MRYFKFMYTRGTGVGVDPRTFHELAGEALARQYVRIVLRLAGVFALAGLVMIALALWGKK
jgi:hypothetical protein